MRKGGEKRMSTIKIRCQPISDKDQSINTNKNKSNDNFTMI